MVLIAYRVNRMTLGSVVNYQKSEVKNFNLGKNVLELAVKLYYLRLNYAF